MGTSWPASARKLARPMPKTPRLSQAGQFVFFSPITYGIVRQAYPLVLTPTNKRAENRQPVAALAAGPRPGSIPPVLTAQRDSNAVANHSVTPSVQNRVAVAVAVIGGYI